MVQKMLLLCILLSCLVATILIEAATTSSSPHAESIRACMQNSLKDKRYRTKNLDDMFSMHYGDPAVETFYAVNSQDLKQIEALSDCIATLDVSRYQTKSDSHLYQGSSVTKMDGLFAELLPDILTKIKMGLKDASKEAEWNIPVDSLSLHSADFVDHISSTPKVKYEVPKENRVRAFVLGGHKTLSDEEQAIEDARIEPNSDFAIAQNLMKSAEDRLTVLLQVNERSEHEGGSFLVKRYKSHVIEGKYSDGNLPDELTDEEIELEDREGNALATTTTHRVLKGGMEVFRELEEKPLSIKYSPMHTIFRRYPLDKYQLLVLQIGSHLGIESVTEGRKIFCKLEFSF